MGVASSSLAGDTTSRDGLEMVPAESHKLNDAGSIPAPATKMSFPTPEVSE